ncbi:hypothetical protein [Mycolicibacter minnesotensis]
MLDWFRDDIVGRGRLPLLCCLLAFLVTFLVTRATVRYIRSNADRGAAPRWWQPRNLRIGSQHIHHVVFGVVLVLVSGVTLVTIGASPQEPGFTLAAIAFGIGAALVLDEYALILHLSDVYWAEDGRASVDAVFAATAVAGLLVLGFHPLTFLVGTWHDTSSPLIRAGVFTGLVTALPLGVMVLLKGKVWTGLIGMFFFPLLVIGAVRLSRPHAPWARWRYLPDRERMHRALERERRWRRPVIAAKLWLQDAIAGRPQLPDDLVLDAELDREVRAAAAPTVQFMAPRVQVPIGRPLARSGPTTPARPAPPAPGSGGRASNRAVAEASAPTRPFVIPRSQRPGEPRR